MHENVIWDVHIDTIIHTQTPRPGIRTHDIWIVSPARRTSNPPGREPLRVQTQNVNKNFTLNITFSTLGTFETLNYK